MTCSLSKKEKIREMEAEAQMFWKVNKLGWELFRRDPGDPLLYELRDEIEVMALNTDWPLLRDTCHRVLRRADELLPQRAIAAS